MWKLAAIFMMVCVISTASQVTKTGDGTASVTQDAQNPWKLQDKVCIFHHGKKQVCGRVTQISEEQATVKLNKPKSIQVGDDVYRLLPPSFFHKASSMSL